VARGQNRARRDQSAGAERSLRLTTRVNYSHLGQELLWRQGHHRALPRQAAGYAPGPAFLKGGGSGALVLRRYARRMIRARTMPSATLNGVAPDAAAQRSTPRVMAPMRATEVSTASGWSSMVFWWKSMTPPAYLVRYIDDFVVCFQYRSDALRLQEALRRRLGRFGLTFERFGCISSRDGSR
jgi:hypothetical protein